jgi:S1-C subfamily serine protease
MTKSLLSLVILLSMTLTSGLASAQESANDPGEAGELEAAEARLEDARRRLEEAAREVANLSAQRAGPRMRNVYIARGFDGTRPLLGLNIDDAEDGVRVVGVTPNGAADEAGVRSGDTIISIDGQSLTAGGAAAPTRRLFRHLAAVDVGDTVELTVIRDGEELDIDVVTRDMGPGTHAIRRFDRFDAPFPIPRGGRMPNFDVNRGDDYTFFFNPGLVTGPWRSMELVALTPALGEYFGTEEGLLVVRAPANESLGLVDGDVILEIGGRAPTSAEHAIRILTSFEPEEELELQIMRQRRPQALSIDLE